MACAPTAGDGIAVLEVARGPPCPRGVVTVENAGAIGPENLAPGAGIGRAADLVRVPAVNLRQLVTRARSRLPPGRGRWGGERGPRRTPTAIRTAPGRSRRDPRGPRAGGGPRHGEGIHARPPLV